METPPAPRVVRPFDGPSLIWVGLVTMPLLWWGSKPSLYYLAWILVIPGAILLALALPAMRALFAPLSARGRPVVFSWRGRTTSLVWLALVVGLLALQVPLRVHFAVAKPALVERARGQRTGEHWPGFYEIRDPRPGRCDERRTLLPIENDIESFFVYAPEGMDGFCYNSGIVGSLGDGWYFAVED